MLGLGALDIFQRAEAHRDSFGRIGNIDGIARFSAGLARALDQRVAALLGLLGGQHRELGPFKRTDVRPCI